MRNATSDPLAPLRLAVIGTGHLGTIHARLWNAQVGARLIAVVDIEADRADAAAIECSDEHHRVRAAQTLAEVLHDVDAITIATPTSTHFAVALQCLRAGKHCFIEKPITTTADEAAVLIKEARKNNCIVQVGHVERFNPALLALDVERIQPLFIEAHRLAQFKLRATDVSVVLDLMIHDIDLALWLAKSPVKEVHANGVAVLTDIPDIANARIVFENGCVANITASRISANPMRKMRMFSRDGYISLDFADNSAETFTIMDEGQKPTPSIMTHENAVPALMLGNIETGKQNRSIWYAKSSIEKVNAIAEEQRTFLEAVQAGRIISPRAASADEAMAALRVVEAISAQMLQL
jgi:predicted dehydrogenase